MYLAAPLSDDGMIGEFDETGRLVRIIGRTRGASSLSAVADVHDWKGDSLVALDIHGISVLTAEGSVVRQTEFSDEFAGFRLTVLPGGHVALNTVAGTDGAIAILDTSLALIRRFGGRPVRGRPDPSGLIYHLAPGPGTTILAAKGAHEHALEVWDTSGALLRRFVEAPSWFRRWKTPVTDDGPPRVRPHISSVHLDGDSRVWLAVVVPNGQDTGPIDEKDNDGLLETILEVVDPATGRVMIATHIPGVINQFLENGFLYGKSTDQSGQMHFEVYRPRISGHREHSYTERTQ